MKRFAGLILAILLTMSLFAGTAMAEEKIKLQFMAWEASVYETEANLAALRSFEEAYPECEVEFITGKSDDHHTRLMTMMAGNAAPDVFYMDVRFSREFSDQGLLLDVSDIFENEMKGTKLIDWSYQKTISDDGAYYGIDCCATGFNLVINVDLFKAAGLEVPSTEKQMTWDEMLDLAQKLTIRDGDKVTQYGVYGFEDRMPVECYLYYNGVGLYNDEGKFEFSDPEKAAEILEAFKALRTQYGVAPDAAFIENSGMSANQLLKTGKVAMVYEGAWNLQELSKMDFDYIALKAPMFDSDHPVGIYASATNCSIWSGTKYPEYAKKLAAFICSEEAQLPYIRDGLWMPNREYYYEPENYDIWLSDAYPEGFEALAPLYKDAVFSIIERNPHANEISNMFLEEIQNYFYLDQPVAETLENIERRANTILER